MVFEVLAVGSLVSSIGVIYSRNSIYSVLYLTLTYCNVSGLLLLLQVEFLAILLVVVYVGAIAVLFLFVVMLLNIRVIEYDYNALYFLPVGIFMLCILYVEILIALSSESFGSVVVPFNYKEEYINWADATIGSSNIEKIGEVLYLDYKVLFLLCGILLLVSMVVAVSMVLERRSSRFIEMQDMQIEKQHVVVQVNRGVYDVVNVE